MAPNMRGSRLVANGNGPDGAEVVGVTGWALAAFCANSVVTLTVLGWLTKSSSSARSARMRSAASLSSTRITRFLPSGMVLTV